jgi:glycosyltransferase involved in cell wall biosynthesis
MRNIMTPNSTTNEPAVTVAMVVHRPDPRHLREAVASLLAQSLKEIEIVIVEDPSERLSGDVVSAFRDSRIKYFVNQCRTSLVDQRNLSITLAHAEMVAILDGDDIAEPARLEKQWWFLRANPHVGVVGSQISVIDGTGAQRGFRNFPLRHAGITAALKRIVPLNQSSVMFRKSLIQAVGGYQTTTAGLAEDYHLWSRLAHHGVQFANLPERLIRYRIHTKQMKALHMHQTIRSILEIKRLYWRNQMGFRAEFRMYLEHGLLRLPEPLVYSLLFWIHYRGFPFFTLPPTPRQKTVFDGVQSTPENESLLSEPIGACSD